MSGRTVCTCLTTRWRVLLLRTEALKLRESRKIWMKRSKLCWKRLPTEARRTARSDALDTVMLRLSRTEAVADDRPDEPISTAWSVDSLARRTDQRLHVRELDVVADGPRLLCLFEKLTYSR